MLPLVAIFMYVRLVKVCKIGKRGEGKLTFGARRPGASPGGPKTRVTGSVGELGRLRAGVAYLGYSPNTPRIFRNSPLGAMLKKQRAASGSRVFVDFEPPALSQASKRVLGSGPPNSQELLRTLEIELEIGFFFANPLRAPSTL